MKMIMKNKIWDRNIIAWINLLFAVLLAILVTLDIYRNHITISTLVGCFFSGLSFTTWLFSGLISRSNDVAKDCLNQTQRVLNAYEKYSKSVDKNMAMLQKKKYGKFKSKK